jgi:hypothetical protein
MAKKKELTRSPLREKKARSTEEIRKKMVGSQYVRRNFLITPADDYLLEVLVKRIRTETDMETTKSAIVRKAIRQLRGMEIKKLMGV